MEHVKHRFYFFMVSHLCCVLLFAVAYAVEASLSRSRLDHGSLRTEVTYYVWFSLLTQTTVGYNAPPEVHRRALFMFLNALQLVSIPVLAAVTLARY